MNFIFFLISFIPPNPTTGEESRNIQCTIQACNNGRTFFAIINDVCIMFGQRPSSNIMSPSQKVYQKSYEGVTLFRIISGSEVKSYDYYTKKRNLDQFADDAHKNFSQNFRSLLLDEWDSIRPMQMNVTIRNDDDFVVAYLVFMVNVYDNMTSWFDKKNLIRTFPWNLDTLVQQNYYAFSVEGFTGRNTLKRF